MSELDQRFQALRTRFVARSRGDLAALRVETDPVRLRFIVHRLSGAAGVFGFRAISADAGEIDDALIEGRAPPAEVMARLIAALEAIEI